MSATLQQQAPTRSVIPPALAAAAITGVLLLWANYVDTPWRDPGAEWGIDQGRGPIGLLLVAGFAALGVLVVFGVVAKRALADDPTRTARVALILSLVAVPAIVVFWTGLPIVLGLGAAFLGLDARSRLDRTPPSAGVAVGLGLLAAASAAFVCVTG